MLKRFESSELGESASRRVGYHCTADYAKSSKAKCRVCSKIIEQNELRLALMLQDEEGYKSTAWTHYDCFWKHPETRKLDDIEEIYNFSKLKAEDRAKITTAFEDFNATKTPTKKKKKNTPVDNDYTTTSKPIRNKTTKKQPSVTSKRKRDVEED